MVCMALLVISLTETVLIVRLVHKQDLQSHVPQWVKHLVLEKATVLLCIRNKKFCPLLSQGSDLPLYKENNMNTGGSSGNCCKCLMWPRCDLGLSCWKSSCSCVLEHDGWFLLAWSKLVDHHRPETYTTLLRQSLVLGQPAKMFQNTVSFSSFQHVVEETSFEIHLSFFKQCAATITAAKAPETPAET